jgi:(2S)-methylsuccinyl-CoA dehydrogenase
VPSIERTKMTSVQERLASGCAVAMELVAAIHAAVARKVCLEGKVSRTRINAEQQHAAHGLTWYATYAEVFRSLNDWVESLTRAGRLREVESCIVDVLLDEYLAQMLGGIAMSQGEIARPTDFELPDTNLAGLTALVKQRRPDERQASRTRLAALIAEARGRPTAEDTGLDPELEMIRERFHAFTDAQVLPHAQTWHRTDALIPLELVEQLTQLGVFGLAIPAARGGCGLGKVAMCVVSEELSRGYLGVGSLATRSEIAAELICGGGTAQQQERWLPAIASGKRLPTAVFTEPNSGSDLSRVAARAIRAGPQFLVSGNKTWITHAARADLMLLLVRTELEHADHRGLSILVAEKCRGSETAPFPVKGMRGGEIPVLGYRGMKEYEIGFDEFAVPTENLLGDSGGQGFRQLMSTFETARIQTAARAIGVAQCALENGLQYATGRRQFGQPIYDFPRIHNKLALMVAEIAAVRQLTYCAARRKDLGARCDLEAGMAKLLAARVAWSAADNNVQIHGGNGFALEYPASRLLCDARVLSIFEGAAEIQAQVIARRLLGD